MTDTAHASSLGDDSVVYMPISESAIDACAAVMHSGFNDCQSQARSHTTAQRSKLLL